MNRDERDETPLARTMRALAEVESGADTPARVEAALMARWDLSRRSGAKADAAQTMRPRSQARRVVRGAVATAAGITIVGAVAWPRGGQAPNTSGDRRPDDRAYTTVGVVGGPLMAGEQVRVVRMRVARSALSELGVAATGQTETVDIDVLVGEDGVARGVRVPIKQL